MTTADSVAHALAHAFDFWLGEWDVHDPEGNHIGRNSITDLYGTGALAEHWRGDRGVEGHSLSAWDGISDDVTTALSKPGSRRSSFRTRHGIRCKPYHVRHVLSSAMIPHTLKQARSGSVLVFLSRRADPCRRALWLSSAAVELSEGFPR